jgi:hypothetical protein
MAGRQRTTFAKLQRERARQEKQAAKRARRQGLDTGPEGGEEPRSSDEFFGPNGEVPAWLEDPESTASATTPGGTDAG